jgi:hypothetical protein
MHVRVHRIGQVYEADLKFAAICLNMQVVHAIKFMTH